MYKSIIPLLIGVLVVACQSQPTTTSSPSPSPTSTVFEPPKDSPAPSHTITKERRAPRNR